MKVWVTAVKSKSSWFKSTRLVIKVPGAADPGVLVWDYWKVWMSISEFTAGTWTFGFRCVCREQSGRVAASYLVLETSNQFLRCSCYYPTSTTTNPWNTDSHCSSSALIINVTGDLWQHEIKSLLFYSRGASLSGLCTRLRAAPRGASCRMMSNWTVWRPPGAIINAAAGTLHEISNLSIEKLVRRSPWPLLITCLPHTFPHNRQHWLN